jgi:hypothetical protein
LREIDVKRMFLDIVSREKTRAAEYYILFRAGMDAAVLYLGGKSLDQNGDQQVEKNVVAKGHEGDEVESGPVAGFLHAVEEHNIPVLLGQDLRTKTVSPRAEISLGAYV